jgi:hypothetical protein
LSVALTDTPLGHLEFALCREGIDLPVIEAVFGHIEPGELVGRLRESLNGEYIRRAAFLRRMFQEAVEQEIPRELFLLRGIEFVFSRCTVECRIGGLY